MYFPPVAAKGGEAGFQLLREENTDQSPVNATPNPVQDLGGGGGLSTKKNDAIYQLAARDRLVADTAIQKSFMYFLWVHPSQQKHHI